MIVPLPLTLPVPLLLPSSALVLCSAGMLAPKTANFLDKRMVRFLRGWTERAEPKGLNRKGWTERAEPKGF